MKWEEKEKELQEWADLLHGAFCKRPHQTPDNIQRVVNGRIPGCHYYIEHIYDTRWQEADHRQWLEVARIVLEEAEEADVLKSLQALRTAIEQLELIKSGPPSIGALCCALIKDECGPSRTRPKSDP